MGRLVQADVDPMVQRARAVWRTDPGGADPRVPPLDRAAVDRRVRWLGPAGAVPTSSPAQALVMGVSVSSAQAPVPSSAFPVETVAPSSVSRAATVVRPAGRRVPPE